MAKETAKNERTAAVAAVASAIAAHPTASDAQIAAIAEVKDRALVSDVRADMGPKHTWPKEDKK